MQLQSIILPHFSYKGGVLHAFHVALAAIKFYHKIWACGTVAK
jgi:hypothetical protein